MAYGKSNDHLTDDVDVNPLRVVGVERVWRRFRSLIAFSIVITTARKYRDLLVGSFVYWHFRELSRKQLEIDARFHWTTNRKWHMANRMVTCSTTSRDLARSSSWPRYVWDPLSQKRLEVQIIGYSGAPIGYGTWTRGIKWSRHVSDDVAWS